MTGKPLHKNDISYLHELLAEHSVIAVLDIVIAHCEQEELKLICTEPQDSVTPGEANQQSPAVLGGSLRTVRALTKNLRSLKSSVYLNQQE